MFNITAFIQLHDVNFNSCFCKIYNFQCYIMSEILKKSTLKLKSINENSTKNSQQLKILKVAVSLIWIIWFVAIWERLSLLIRHSRGTYSLIGNYSLLQQLQQFSAKFHLFICSKRFYMRFRMLLPLLYLYYICFQLYYFKVLNRFVFCCK